jgi:hypothetical protein
MRVWREDPALRQDAAAAPTLVRWRAIVGLVFAATFLGSAMLGAALVHIVAD